MNQPLQLTVANNFGQSHITIIIDFDKIESMIREDITYVRNGETVKSPVTRMVGVSGTRYQVMETFSEIYTQLLTGMLEVEKMLSQRS